MAWRVLPLQIVWTNPKVSPLAEPPIEQLPRIEPLHEAKGDFGAKSKLLRNLVYVNQGECCYLPPNNRNRLGEFLLCMLNGLVCLPH